MRRIIFLTLCAGFLMTGCKKDAGVKVAPAATSGRFAINTQALSATPAQSLKGVNWACDSDNFSDGILVLSGLTSSDSYSTVTTKASAILSGVQTNTGANTIRIPINYPTVSQSWWNSYTAVIDEATSKGMNVIVGCWEGKSSQTGMIHDTTQFWSMWQTVVNKYGSNSQVYFEIFNEPHGYTLSGWTAVCAKWLSKYPAIPQGRILIDGTSYAQDVTGVGADSRFTGCLLSLHDYTFFSNGTLTTAAQWENRVSSNVGNYGSRTVVTEFGDTMNTGINYTGPIGGSQDNAYIMGFTNEIRTLGMGSVYWPGIRKGDSYAMMTLSGTTVSTTNSSGLSRLKYGWGIGNGGTNAFYAGAYYRFLNVNSGLALDVNGASTANGASMIQWPQNGNNNQQWIITGTSGSYCKIINRNSGLALEVAGQSTANGANIDQWSWWGGNNQQWTLYPVTTGIYQVSNANSSLAMEVAGQSIANGANIDQWSWWSGNNQQWIIVQQ